MAAGARAGWRDLLLSAKRQPARRLDLQYQTTPSPRAVVNDLRDFMAGLGGRFGSIPYLGITERNTGRQGHHAHLLVWTPDDGGPPPTAKALRGAWRHPRHARRRGSIRTHRLWDDPSLPAHQLAQLWRAAPDEAYGAIRDSEDPCPNGLRSLGGAVEYAVKRIHRDDAEMAFPRDFLTRIGARALEGDMKP